MNAQVNVQNIYRQSCISHILELTVFEDRREEQGRERVTVPRTKNRRNSPLTLPNKGKGHNEVNHHEANNNTTEKEVSKTCGHLQVKEGKSDTWIGVIASILVK